MITESKFKVWSQRLLFAMIAFLIILMPLLPINLSPSSWTQPDLLFVLSFALVLRKPTIAPYWIVGILFLLSDFLRILPLGLGAAIALLVLEALRRNRRVILENMFLGEVIAFVFFSLALVLLEFFIRSLFLVSAATLQQVLMGWAATIIAYPLAIVPLHLIFGLYNRDPKTVEDEGTIA